MSAREWQPGDVAMVTYRPGVEAVSMLTDRGDLAPLWIAGDERCWARDGEMTARPLVVIDPEQITGPDETCGEGAAEEIVKCLRRLAEADHPSSYRRKVAERIADEIEAQACDPTPDEPTGLGAACIDSDGMTWVRNPEIDDDPGPWFNRHGDFASWGQIAAVRVLSEGVTP